MPRIFSSWEIEKILLKNGFIFVSQKGSHQKFFSSQSSATVILPAKRKAIPTGTFKSILRQSKLDSKRFES